MNTTQLKQISLIDALATLNIHPEKIKGDDYWYLSPLRKEKHPSFKVNRKKNVWYDFGTGKGGTIIDFGIRYYHCTISELLERSKNSFSFHQPNHIQKPQLAGQKKKIEVIAAISITHPALCRYLHNRNIFPELAQKYCKEVHYSLYGKHFFAVGFKNNSRGYELRNAHFKSCVSPKDVTLIAGKSESDVATFSHKNAKSIAVFEGFFSFLSYLKLKKTYPSELPNLHTDFLILNSLSFFKKSRKIMEKHTAIHLYLDRDAAGRKYTEKALGWSEKYKDCSGFYWQNKDLNEWLIQQENTRALQTDLSEKNGKKFPYQNNFQRSGNAKFYRKEEGKMIQENKYKRIILSHKKGRGI